MKKVIFLLIFSITTIAGFSQSSKKWRGNYLLNGYLSDPSVKEVILEYTADTKKGPICDTLTAAVANQKFSFSDFIDEPFFATLHIGENQLKFFIDPTVINIEIDSNNSDFTIKGSPTSDEYLEIEALRDGFKKKNEKELASLHERQKTISLSNIDEINRIHIKTANLEAQVDLAALTFAAKEKGSFAVLYQMNEMLSPENKYYKKEVCTQILRIYSQMPESLKDTPTGVNVSGKLLMASMNMKF